MSSLEIKEIVDELKAQHPNTGTPTLSPAAHQGDQTQVEGGSQIDTKMKEIEETLSIKNLSESKKKLHTLLLG